jgi:metallo-beta-lactamase family protein
MLSVTFCGAARTVTGSQYFLEYVAPDGGKVSFCLDSGMFQVGQKVNLFKINSHMLFDPKKLDLIVLTHGHLDHCGRIPYLVKMGFGGRIFSTEATRQIAEIVMTDASRHQGDGSVTPDISQIIHDSDRVDTATSERFKPNDFGAQLPNKAFDYETDRLFTEEHVLQAVSRFKTHEYHRPFNIHPNLQVEFWDAGHILGSAFVVFTELSSGRKIAFSGDLGNTDKPIIEDPEMPPTLPGLTHIFTETTYGNRLHGKHDPRQKLKVIAKETLSRGGTLLIPSFSVERAQEVIYYLVDLMRSSELVQVPIYLDSPMASKVLRVCLDHPELYDEELREKIRDKANPLIYKNLEILETVDESKTLNKRDKPCIIIAGSGMLNGGRILKHLQFRLENPNDTLLFVGYQAAGTLGREILEGAKEVEIEGRLLNVNVRIEVINEFSAHADQKLLKKWIFSLVGHKPAGQAPTVFLMHGEKEASLALGEELKGSLMDAINTYWPRFGEKVQLWE